MKTYVRGTFGCGLPESSGQDAQNKSNRSRTKRGVITTDGTDDNPHKRRFIPLKPGSLKGHTWFRRLKRRASIFLVDDLRDRRPSNLELILALTYFQSVG